MIDNLTFENAILRLEEIAKALEEGKLPLAKSVELYKEGMELSVFCNKEIEKARLTVEEFSDSAKTEE